MLTSFYWLKHNSKFHWPLGEAASSLATHWTAVAVIWCSNVSKYYLPYLYILPHRKRHNWRSPTICLDHRVSNILQRRATLMEFSSKHKLLSTQTTMLSVMTRDTQPPSPLPMAETLSLLPDTQEKPPTAETLPQAIWNSSADRI